MINSKENITVSKITNEDISNANSKIDLETLSENDNRMFAFIILILFLFVVLGMRNEKDKKEILRKKKLLDRKKRINIHLEKNDVNKIWEKIYNEKAEMIHGE